MPKYVDHAERRRELLHVAATIIAAEGIEAATVRRIASESGFTTGMVTHYFASKDELLICTMRQVHRRAAERMLTRRQGHTGMQALRAVLSEALPLTAETKTEGRVWLAYCSATWTNQQFMHEQREHYAAWRWLITTLLAEASASGHVMSDLDLEITADRLIAAVDGLGIHAVYEPDRMTPARLLAALDAELSQLTWPKATVELPSAEATRTPPGPSPSGPTGTTQVTYPSETDTSDKVR